MTAPAGTPAAPVRRHLQRIQLGIVAIAAVLAATACGGRNDSGSGASERGGGRAPRPPGETATSDTGDTGGAAGAGEAALRAAVDRVLMPHHIRPDESLAVHLLGTIGPNGSWALDRVDVRHEGDRVVIEPRVRRVAGDMFIQMVIPLDRTVEVALAAGVHRIEVLQRDTAIIDTVVVAAGVQREPPVAELAPAGEARVARVDSETLVSLPFKARVADGWIARVDVRDAAAGPAGAWRAPEALQREDAGGVHGTVTVRRPAGDPPRTVEARAVDGQGAVSRVVSVQLPAL